MNKKIVKTLIIGSFLTLFYFVTKKESEFLALDASTNSTEELMLDDNINFESKEMVMPSSPINAGLDPSYWNIQVIPYTGTYDGNYHSIEIIIPKTITDAIVTYKYNDSAYTTENFSFKDPGSYKVVYNISFEKGKKLIPGIAYVTINKITIDTSSYYNYQIQEFTYDGKLHFPNYNITKPSIATDMSFDFCPQTDAGTYSITYSFTYDTSIYYIPDVVLQWKILPKTVNIIWGDGEYFTYDGTEHKPRASYLDINAGYHSLTLTCEDGFVNAGKHTAVASKTDNLTNYKLSDNPSDLTHEFTIYGKDISNATVEYGSTSLTYNGLEQGPSITSITLADWEDEITYELQGLATNYSLTNYTLKICGTGNYTGEISIPYQINKKAAEVIWPTTPTYTYNGLTQSYKPYIVDVFLEDMALDVTFNKEFKDAGTYTMTVNEASYHNYSLTNTSSSIVMNKKEATIVYEQTEFTYNTNVQEVKAYFMNCSNNKEYVTVTIDGEFKNAGEYDVVANVDNITNYTLSNTSTKATIAPYEVTINWPTHITYIYYHNVQQVNAKITDPLGNVIQFVATTDREFKDAGEYDVEVNEEEFPNYSFTNPTWQAIMNPAKSTIVYENTNYIYNGSIQEVKAYYVNGLKQKEYVTVTIDGEFKNAGEYDVASNIEDITNYDLSNATTKITILPLEVEVIWSNNNYAYNSLIQTIEAKYVDVSSTEQNLVVSINKEFKNAGDYIATVSLDDTNYTLTNPTKEYNILPVEVEVVWEETTYTYNGNIQEVKATYTDIEEEKQSAIVTLDRQFKDKGEYLATASIEGNNYTITNPTRVYEILPLGVEVIWNEDNYTYNGNIQEVSAKFIDVLNNEKDLTVAMDKEFKNAGEYLATAYLNNNNYLLTNNTKAYNIKKHDIEIIWGEEDYTYNGQTQKIEASYVELDKSTIELVVTIDKVFRDASDDYVASISLDNPNYNVINPTKEYTIKALVSEVVWNDVTYTYNGKVQEITASYLDAANILRQTNIAIDKEFKDAGSYVATASIDNNNYELTNITHNYEILPLEILAIWSRDEFTYNGSTREITATYEDMDGNSYNLVVVGGQNIDVNTYLATAILDDDNYVLSNPTHEYVINPLEVETKWSETEFIYNGMVQEITAYFTNENYEKISVIVTVNKEFKDVGEYLATASIENDNYTLTNTTCEYEILPLEVSAILEDIEYIYNGNTQEVKMYFIDALGVKNDLVATTNNSFNNAGNYIATATLEDSNYTLIDCTHSVVMNPLKVQIYSDNKDYYYNGEIQEVEFKYKNVKNEEVVLYTLRMKDVNTYNVNYDLRDRNYVIEGDTSATIIMNKGSLNIPNSKIVVFDYTGGVITFLPEGFDENTMSITNNRHAESNMDGYKAVVSIKDKNNYTWKDGTTDDKTFTYKIKNASSNKKGCKSATIPSIIGLFSIASFLVISKKKRTL